MLCLPGLAIVIALSQGDDFSASAAAWAIASVVAGACAYTAVFGALSLRVKRPVVIGLIYVLFWEGSIATFAPSARWLSLGAYAARGRRRRAAGIHRLQRAGDRRVRGGGGARGSRGGGHLVVWPAPRARRVALTGSWEYGRRVSCTLLQSIQGVFFETRQSLRQ